MVALFVRVSAGTQNLLGLKSIKVDAPMHMAYLMISRGQCDYDCSYCAQARAAQSKRDRLSRVVWPEYDFSEVLDALENSHDQVKRLCLQVTSNKQSKEDALRVVKALGSAHFPVSISVRPESLKEVEEFMHSGAERVGIAVDAVEEDLFLRIRGGSLKRHLDLLCEAASQFPGKITTHAIVGIGETDRSLVDFFVDCYFWGIKVGLFSFTPVRGTGMSDHLQPSLERYRRVQLARFLIEEDVGNTELLEFDTSENLVGTESLFSDNSTLSKALLTSGCPDCTRPFYNERPGHVMFNVFT
ncbi:MAG: Radical SAM domain protein [Thermotogales bacterium 46_20]|nr:MAG: Radical SAM domain protein [Thermotogales bacterium 46_20]